MIVLTVLLAVNMPLNCQRVLLAIMKLTNLDVIDTEPFLTGIFTFKAQADPRNEVFADAGYETSNFIIELGPLFIIIIVTIISFGFRHCLQSIAMKCGDNWITRCIQIKISTKVVIVRFLIESCIELGLVALVAIVMI